MFYRDITAYHRFKNMAGCFFALYAGFQTCNDLGARRQAFNPQGREHVIDGFLFNVLSGNFSHVFTGHVA